jgi:uncharacterized SAM-binding protein YcdF (DUF218 family)
MNTFWRPAIKIFGSVWRTVASLLLLLVLVIHFTPLVPWYARWLAGGWPDDEGDILIVLSSEIQTDGILGSTSYLRSLYAVRAYRQHPFRAIVVSGGYTPGASISLAAAMREFLVANGVPREIVFAEERSHSTRENALYIKALIERWPGKRILLTSDYHVFRAERVFRKAGLPVVARPLPDVLKHYNHWIERWSCFWGLAEETAKIVYYAARGWI